jgi:hypothetical protein
MSVRTSTSGNCVVCQLELALMVTPLMSSNTISTIFIHARCFILRDRPFNLQGTTRELEYMFLSRKVNIRLDDKNSESDYFFFPPPKSEYFFQQHWESEYFFRNKP